MRILLSIHHPLVADAGAPGATLALARGLREAGNEVDILSFDSVARVPGARGRELLYPELAALRLRALAGRYDVIDASTGDAWVWAALGRPGGCGVLLVTRSHGLEHVFRAARSLQSGLRGIGERAYHDRFRLWEVARSLREADLALFLNEADRTYAIDHLQVEPERAAVVPNGIDDTLLGLPAPRPHSGPLRAAVIGSWDRRKGSHVITEAIERCANVIFTILGAGDGAPVPRGAKPVPRFDRIELPRLLKNQDVVVSASLAEGFSLALVEAMACGLAPVATAVGAAPELLGEGAGLLIAPGSVDGLVAALRRLDADRELLFRTRAAAWRTAQRYSWEAAGARSVELYEHALATRHA